MMDDPSKPRQISVGIEEVPSDPTVRRLRVAYTEMSLTLGDGSDGSCYVTPGPVSIVVEAHSKIYRVDALDIVKAALEHAEPIQSEWSAQQAAETRPESSNDIVMSLVEKMKNDSGLRAMMQQDGLEMTILRRAAEIDGQLTTRDFVLQYMEECK